MPQFARSLAVSLALCAMVLRAFLPEGWMPSAGAPFGPFVICAADGTHHDGKAPAQAPSSHAPCAFAATAPLSPPATVSAALAGAGQFVRLAAALGDEDVFDDLAYRPNAARAPPAFS